jgi:hypothetical protein
MAHIAVNEQLPGFIGLLQFKTVKHLNELARIFLCCEREIMASCGSYKLSPHPKKADDNMGEILVFE